MCHCCKLYALLKQNNKTENTMYCIIFFICHYMQIEVILITIKLDFFIIVFEDSGKLFL